ncbi:hypothetical protein J0S82_010495, partial [Galemys pyrenaicus]
GHSHCECWWKVSAGQKGPEAVTELTKRHLRVGGGLKTPTQRQPGVHAHACRGGSWSTRWAICVSPEKKNLFREEKLLRQEGEDLDQD